MAPNLEAPAPAESPTANACETRSRSQTKPQRKSSSLPAETVEYLKAWMMSPEHVAHPYPTEQEKAQIMADTGIELKQLTNWFVNNRKRYWKPRVEARLQQQAQAHAQAAAAAAAVVAVSQVVTSNEAHSNPSILPAAANAATPTPFISLDMTQPPPQIMTPQQITQPMAMDSCVEPQVFHHFNHEGHRRVSVDSSHIALLSHVLQPQPQVLSPRAVSEGSASVTESDGNSTSNDDDGDDDSYTLSVPSAGGGVCDAPELVEEINEHTGIVTRKEVVDVHILRPSGNLGLEVDQAPSIHDVTILSNVPRDRIVKSFPKCQICYCFPQEIAADRKKVQSRRDAEVVRVKRHYLKLYQGETSGSLATITSDEEESVILAPVTRIRSVSEPEARIRSQSPNQRVRPRAISFNDARTSSIVACDGDDELPQAASPKRMRIMDSKNNADVAVAGDFRGRPTYYCQNMEKWRDACRQAKTGYDHSLPSLEEAAHMFGYSA